jgi:hypothetical protein
VDRAEPALQVAGVAELGEVGQLAGEASAVAGVESGAAAVEGEETGGFQGGELVAQRRPVERQRGEQLVFRGLAGGEQLEEHAIDGLGVADHEVVLAGADEEQPAVRERERLHGRAQGVPPPARGACGRGRREG